MDEATARDVVLVRAIETTDDAHELWTDADRIFAGRTAAESVGAAASVDAFVGQRAALALERLGKREPKARAVWHAPVPRLWLGGAAMALAFVVGVAGVDIGPGRRINLLAPPVLALLLWNLAVYGMLVEETLRRLIRRGEPAGGALRSIVARLLGEASRRWRPQVASGVMTKALARFAAEWPALAAPLWRQRAALVLHAAAAALAAGAIAGLYLRGVALEYRAGWESTFLDANDVARLLQVVLAPGALLTGIPIPGADHLRQLAGASAGEIAAPWIHLYAATIGIVVIVPRLVLAAVAGMRERRLKRRFPLRLDSPYFQRLLHVWHEGTIRVYAIPYSYDMPAANLAGLATVLTRAFQSPVDLQPAPAVRYGDDEVPQVPAPPLAAVLAVFNMTATPEHENQGAFIGALRGRAIDTVPLLAIVDSSDFTERFREQPARIAEREATWREALAEEDVEPFFMRLNDPDVAAAAAGISQRFERPLR